MELAGGGLIAVAAALELVAGGLYRAIMDIKGPD